MLSVFKKPGKCFPGNAGVMVCIMLSLEWFQRAPPGQVLGTLLLVLAFGEGSSAHPQHLQSAPENGSLCAHTEGGVRSSLP